MAMAIYLTKKELEAAVYEVAEELENEQGTYILS